MCSGATVLRGSESSIHLLLTRASQHDSSLRGLIGVVASVKGCQSCQPQTLSHAMEQVVSTTWASSRVLHGCSCMSRLWLHAEGAHGCVLRVWSLGCGWLSWKSCFGTADVAACGNDRNVPVVLRGALGSRAQQTRQVKGWGTLYAYMHHCGGESSVLAGGLQLRSGLQGGACWMLHSLFCVSSARSLGV